MDSFEYKNAQMFQTLLLYHKVNPIRRVVLHPGAVSCCPSLAVSFVSNG